MFFPSWLRKPKPVSTHNRRGPVRYRPTIELLEDRLAPAMLLPSLALYPPPNAVGSPAGGQFGESTATDSGFTVVGMPNANNGSGAAFVYSATTDEPITLVNPSPGSGDYFGQSVSISGNTVVVGAWSDYISRGNHGRAYVYRIEVGPNATTGVLIATLANPSRAGGFSFGESVSVSGNTVVVGDGGNDQAYVFNATTGALIVPLVDPSPTKGGDAFGWSVSVSGNTAVVGASYSGKAYVFNATTGDLIVALDNPSPASNNNFGESVSVSGNTVVVGAPGDNTGSGRAYVYRIEVGPNATTGVLIDTLANPTPASNDHFGWSVSVSGNTVVVGAIGDDTQSVDRGAAYVFVLDFAAVSVSDATVTEGDTGTVNATFTLTLSRASTDDVTVHYDTADISAVAGSDYTAASGDVIIPAGQTSRTFTVAVTGDRLAEPTETFAVNLSAPTNATIGDGQGIGTILDNEPRISISDVTKAEGKNGPTTLFTFTVTLSAAYDQAVTMSYRTVDGTATTSDGDYIAKTGTLTFAPGETTKTITIEVKGDSKKEADETFYLDLFGNSGNSLFTKNRGIGTILNDD